MRCATSQGRRVIAGGPTAGRHTRSTRDASPLRFGASARCLMLHRAKPTPPFTNWGILPQPPPGVALDEAKTCSFLNAAMARHAELVPFHMAFASRRSPLRMTKLDGRMTALALRPLERLPSTQPTSRAPTATASERHFSFRWSNRYSVARTRLCRV